MTAKTTGKPSKKKVSTFQAEEDESPLMVPRVLPRGLNSLPRDVVLLSQRSRLIEATAHFVGTKGYLATSVADLISRAGVSRTTFYQQFKDKEDCYLYCYERLSQSHMERVISALDGKKGHKERLLDSVQAYLEHLAEHGEYAIAFFAEAAYAGERVQAREAELKAEHKNRLASWYEDVAAQNPSLVKPPAAVYDLMIDGSNALLVRWVRDGLKPELAKLHQSICYFFFACLGLHQWAEEVMAG
jgi:AcrR family transcriptional regulator